jgi:ubiquinone/menaquinone biosynthesis C-methylase UbiE
MSNNEYYENDYNLVIETGCVGFMASVYHRMLESGHTEKFKLCLEIGAGTGQHFKYVKHDFDRYISSDIRDFREKSEQILDSRHEFQIQNAESLEAFADGSIDRLIATCVLSHLTHPEKALIEWKRVLRTGGVLDIYVPSEPSLLLGIAQKLTTKIKVEKLGWNYERIQYREHRNHYPMIRMLINDVFQDSKVTKRNFPPGLSFWQFSLFSTFRIFK